MSRAPLAEHWQTFAKYQQPVAASPFSAFSLLHAVRIGYALRSVQIELDGPHKRHTVPQTIALAWVAMFGSLTLAQVLLGMPPLWLTYPSVMITYVLPIALTMHLDALYAMFYRLPDGVRGVLETLIDGFSRIGGLTDLGVDLVRQHPDPNLRGSTFAQLFIATLVAGGGDLILPCFSMLSSNWRVATPPWARGQLALDLWTLPVVAYVYLLLTDSTRQPALLSWQASMKPDVRRDEVKMICAVLLTSLLAIGRSRQVARVPLRQAGHATKVIVPADGDKVE